MKKVLIVEDEMLIGMNTKMMLEQHNYEAVAVSSGEKALASIEEGTIPDLILMDIDLGKNRMDGTEAAQLILKEHDIPVVFLSSHTEREVVEKTEGITSYGYIVKNSGKTVLIASMKMAFKLFEAKIKERAKEEALRESDRQYKQLHDHSIAGIAIHEIVLDTSGKPVDYVFLQANQAFENLTGLRIADILGRRVTEVIPGIENTPFIETYGKVVLTGEPVIFEQYSEPLRRHYAISAYRVATGQFATVFSNITERKRAEEEIQAQKKKLEQKNIALSELVEQIVFEKKRVLEGNKQQITSIVIPIISEMEAVGIDINYIHRLQHSMDTLFSSERSTSLNMSVLSHREAEICNLIKGGLKNKEIASILNISDTTVAKHRMRIRKKLKIANTDTNLETFLQTGS